MEFPEDTSCPFTTSEVDPSLGRIHHASGCTVREGGYRPFVSLHRFIPATAIFSNPRRRILRGGLYIL
eukprot:497936-Pyramimonas_sp.AAC.1